MKSVKFVAKNKSTRKDGTTPIYLQYNYTRDKRTLLNTGKYIPTKHWNYEASKLKKNHPDYDEYFNFIDSLRKKLEYIVDQAIIKGIDPTIEYVKRKFELDITFENQEEKKDFFTQLDEFIEGSKLRVTNDVIKDYNSLKKHLLSFQKFKKISLTFRSINYENYVKLREYLIYEVKKPDKTKGLAINTVGKQIKNLKAFMRDCIKRGIIEYNDLSFLKVETEEVDNIYLNENEIQKIYSLDLSEKPHLIKYRDLFIIGCETGLRFSDFSDIKPGHIKGNFIRKKVLKTHRSIVIPISPLLHKIFEKYNNAPPNNISLQKFNGAIKRLGELAELNEDIITVKKVGINKVETTSKKFELMSSHTCRRSFCTNQFNRGMPTLLIRKISGHKTESAFLRYIKIDEDEAAQKMLILWQNDSL